MLAALLARGHGALPRLGGGRAAQLLDAAAEELLARAPEELARGGVGVDAAVLVVRDEDGVESCREEPPEEVVARGERLVERVFAHRRPNGRLAPSTAPAAASRHAASAAGDAETPD
jgi:hypothetical protein